MNDEQIIAAAANRMEAVNVPTRTDMSPLVIVGRVSDTRSIRAWVNDGTFYIALADAWGASIGVTAQISNPTAGLLAAIVDGFLTEALAA